MEFYNLPAYNKARQLAAQLIQSTQKVPRDIKFTYVRDAILVAMRIMEYTAFANETLEQRATYLQMAINDVHAVMIKVRIMYDLRHISRKGYNAITKLEGQLESQLVGWHKSTLEQINKSR